MVKYYTDGGVKNNGKKGFQQAHIACVKENGKLYFNEFIGDKTNNEAELLAILTLLKKTRSKNFLISSDSQVSVNLINKVWKCSMPHLYLILTDIWNINKNYTLIWERRNFNKAGWFIERTYGL